MNANKAKELFEYRDGELYWKVDVAHNVKAGSIAGNIQKTGYKRLRFEGKDYLVHRIIFLIHHGFLPKMVDHHDLNPLNNNIENLRDADRSKNGMNQKLHSNNSLGLKNISMAGNKFRVQIQFNNVYKSIGYFDDLELAELVAIEARDKYHGEYTNHG